MYPLMGVEYTEHPVLKVIQNPIGALDDFDDRTVGFLHGALQLLAGIAAVGEQMDQGRKASQAEAMTEGAPSRSWMLASCTMPASMLPWVSVTMWRLRPLIFFPAS